eukprot:5479076-Pyramimonas_sp.AAC.1
MSGDNQAGVHSERCWQIPGRQNTTVSPTVGPNRARTPYHIVRTRTVAGPGRRFPPASRRDS